MKPYFLTALVLFSHLAFCQFEIGHTTIDFIDPSRNNRVIETEIYYPASASGDNTTPINETFPVIVFGHGFVMAWSAYQNIWEDLVPQGYIMAFPRTEGNALSTNHQAFGWDLQYLVTAMQEEGQNPNSILHQIVREETALMGHSMGGGACFLAADSLTSNSNQNFKTLVGLAPAESTSNGVSSIASAKNIQVPSIIFSGSQDGVTPPEEHHQAMYDSLASECKTFVNILGGAHCYFANSNFNCDFGEGSSSSGISISREEQQDITNDFVSLWLTYSLKSDCNSFEIFMDSLENSNRIEFQQDCTPSPQSYSLTEFIEVCSGDSYIFPDGIEIYNIMEDTIYTSFLSDTQFQCDSIITTEINVSENDLNVIQQGITLNAEMNNVNYQWIDCNTLEEIDGATEQSFNVPLSGSYAVILNNNGCIDTTTCVNVVITSLSEETLNLEQILHSALYSKLVITTLTGQVVQTHWVNQSIDLNLLPTNFYILCFYDNDSKLIQTFKFIPSKMD